MNNQYLPIETISEFHVHFYYDADTFVLAKSLGQTLNELFEVAVGHYHQQPVGPHPMWSCQITVKPQDLQPVLSWLALNRGGLTIFTHPVTGNDLLDHTEHAIWMGSIAALDLSIFSKRFLETSD